MESSTKDATILPLFFSDQALADGSSIKVNPRNENYVGTTESCSCYMNSKVYKYRLKLMMSVPVAGQETGIHEIFYQAGLGAVSFDTIDKTNEAGDTWGSKCELKKETTNEDTTHPIWSTTKLDTTTVLPTDVPGLTSTQAIESVALNNEFADKHSRKNDQFNGLYKKTFPQGFREYSLRTENPFTSDNWYDVTPAAKAMNKGTFCGIWFIIPESALGQFYDADEMTAIGHLRVWYRVEFTEYNDSFMQEA